MDIKGLLTRKVAGVPGWAIAAAGGVAIWFFFLRGAGSASASSSGVSTDSAYGLGYAQGLQSAGANPTTNVAVTPTSPTSPVGFPGGHPGPNLIPSPPGTLQPSASHPGVGDVPSIKAGVGGFVSRGSRSSDWAGNYFHPALTRRVVYSHYVRAIGGPSSHDHEVARVSRGSGIHIARLRALNPVYTGRIRVH